MYLQGNVALEIFPILYSLSKTLAYRKHAKSLGSFFRTNYKANSRTGHPFPNTGQVQYCIHIVVPVGDGSTLYARLRKEFLQRKWVYMR